MPTAFRMPPQWLLPSLVGGVFFSGLVCGFSAAVGGGATGSEVEASLDSSVGAGSAFASSLGLAPNRLARKFQWDCSDSLIDLFFSSYAQPRHVWGRNGLVLLGGAFPQHGNDSKPPSIAGGHLSGKRDAEG